VRPSWWTRWWIAVTGVVLASSSDADLVDALLDIAQVGHRLHAVVTGSDEVASKPAPDMVALATERLHLDAPLRYCDVGGGPAVVVGDATWDVESAVAAGASAIGLRSGGVSADRLLAAGATSVYAGPRDLLDLLEDSPLGTC